MDFKGIKKEERTRKSKKADPLLEHVNRSRLLEGELAERSYQPLDV
jgi:hypothetical protein